MHFLIVGLGNPEKRYEKTRHNVGFEVVKRLAERHNLSFRHTDRLKGHLSSGSFREDKMTLLMPTTYMNNSGEAVSASMNYYKIPKEAVLVIADDAAVPFGEFRLKATGSSGGHNGLQSVEDLLHSKHYARLRIGIGEKTTRDLSDYVLTRFSKEELVRLPELLDQADAFVEMWMQKGVEETMTAANVRQKTSPQKE